MRCDSLVVQLSTTLRERERDQVNEKIRREKERNFLFVSDFLPPVFLPFPHLLSFSTLSFS